MLISSLPQSAESEECLNAWILLLATAATGQWEPLPPAFKVREGAEQFAPSAVVKEGVLTLRNRGAARLKDERPEGATLSFAWKWTEGKEEGKYHDHLIVALFSSGKQAEKWPHEAVDGMLVRLNPGGGSLSVESRSEGKDPVSLAFKDGFVFKKGQEYAIKISCSKENIAVSVDGKEVATTKLPAEKAGKIIFFYNREPVAAVVKESVLSGLKLE